MCEWDHAIEFKDAAGRRGVMDPTIEPEPEGCTATIVHEMDVKWADYLTRTERRWARMLYDVDHLFA
jgi:hypothetical protein